MSTKMMGNNPIPEPEFELFKLEDLPPDSDLMDSPPPTLPFMMTLISAGVIIPIVVTSYRNKLYCMDGRRRLRGSREILRRIEEDPTILEEAQRDNADHLKTIKVQLYKGINPTDRAIWSIILNEQRSSNDLSYFKYVIELYEDNQWETIKKLMSANQQTIKKILSLRELVEKDFIFEQFANGKIAKSTMFKLAKLSPVRQNMALTILKEKKRLTTADLKEVRTAAAKVVLSGLPMNQLKTPIANGNLLYVTMAQDGSLGTPHKDFTKIVQESLDSGGTTYKLVKV